MIECKDKLGKFGTYKVPNVWHLDYDTIDIPMVSDQDNNIGLIQKYSLYKGKYYATIQWYSIYPGDFFVKKRISYEVITLR